MPDKRRYTTVQGDTWDIISKKLYGNEGFVDALISANWQQQTLVIFPAGIVLDVPVITQPERQSVNMPPWRR